AGTVADLDLQHGTLFGTQMTVLLSHADTLRDCGALHLEVESKVTDIDKSTPRAARNEIKLVNGETSHRSGRSFAELGGKKGEINVLDRFDKGVVPHEVSHLGGVDDLYDKTTGLPNPARGDGIMNRVPGVVDSHAIGGIVEGDSAVQQREH
ncbi:hypothetical protein, partial [Stenotrophomonas indicatrix]|uniref:hypothetical protein n=1 Tax=Stenotrophomonas indicatrix TaxID=2045451 RepID=UPI00215AF7D1